MATARAKWSAIKILKHAFVRGRRADRGLLFHYREREPPLHTQGAIRFGR
jgi:hypothetical protein